MSVWELKNIVYICLIFFIGIYKIYHMGATSKELIIPAYLKKGDKVGLVSPAGVIDEDCFKRGVEVLQAWGLNIVKAKHIIGSYGIFSASDKDRLFDFQGFLDDKDITAIFCMRGGYGLARIIDSLNFDKFLLNPKWIIGFSDITVLHSHLQQNLDVASIHAAMPQSYPFDEKGIKYNSPALNSLYTACFGHNSEFLSPVNVNTTLNYDMHIDPIFTNFYRQGSVKAPIIGGNLSVLYSLRGTKTDIDTNGKILFLEDLDEYDYHIDRMLLSLKRGGKFDNLAGVIIGKFSDIKSGRISFGKSVEEIIFSYFKDGNYPVCFGFFAGHIEDNHALYLGKNVEFEVITNIGSAPRISLKFI